MAASIVGGTKSANWVLSASTSRKHDGFLGKAKLC